MGSPGGGPEDKTPPSIVIVTPPSGSVNLDPSSRIEILFSEPVDKATLSASLFISPVTDKKPKITVRGSKVVIRPATPISHDRTMVLTLGAGVSDLHGNRMTDSRSIAMTAGSEIASGRIEGLVFSATPAQGMLVGAWLKTSDSLQINPAVDLPDFLTQVGENAGFALDYLPPADYRMVCWDDKNRDRKYAPGVDRLGLPWHDVSLPDSGRVWIEFFPTLRDSAAPRIVLVTASDNCHLELKFSRSPGGRVNLIADASVISDSTGVLPILYSWYEPGDSSKAVLMTNPQTSKRTYTLKLQLDTLTYEFRGAQEPDTSAPRLVLSKPLENAQDLPQKPAGKIWFSDGIAIRDYGNSLHLVRSDSIGVPIGVWMGAANLIVWEARELLPYGAKCKLILDFGELEDLSGNRAPDSIRTINFLVVDPEETGSITGEVTGDESGRIMVAARSLKSRSSEDKFSVVQSGREFNLPLLPAGDYIIWGFGDRDGDQTFDFGSLSPFEFAERFTVGTDTIQVRTRWETAGMKLEFK